MSNVESLVPSFLIAAPQLSDPHFERRVVLLGEHNKYGSLGWVLNGPILPSVGEILRLAGIVSDLKTIPSKKKFSKSVSSWRSGEAA